MYIVGKVLKPQGNRGEVKVEVITSFPDHFVSLDTVFIEENENWKAYSIDTARVTDRFVFLKFKDIDSIGQAETLRNKYLHIKQEDLQSLSENEFYVHELIGMRVHDENDVYLGEIKDVESYPANDVYVITTPDGVQQGIPAIKEIVKFVDADSNKMIIHVMDGLFD